MRLHARALGYFEAICRHGSIRAAARALHVDASAVQRQLVGLEDQLSVELFERRAGGLHLTESGRLLAGHAVTVLQDEERLAAELAALVGVQRGELSLVCSESANDVLMPDILQEMAQRFPGIRLRSSSANSGDIPALIESGRCDLGLSYLLPKHPSLTCLATGTFTLGAVLAPSHPLAKRTRLSFAECAAYPLIMAAPGMAVRRILEPMMARHKLPLTVLVETSSAVLMKRLALRGLGIAFLAPIGLEAERAAGQLRYIPLSPARGAAVELGLYARAGRTLTPAIRAFVPIVSEHLKAQALAA